MGGGAILKGGNRTHGTATAAAIWATGAVGAAVALDRAELALAVSFSTFLTFLILTPLGHKLHDEDRGSDSK